MHEHHHDRETALTKRGYRVHGDTIETSGALMLPTHVCVRCGSREQGGEIRSDTLTWVTPWLWLTLLISGLITIIAYLTLRKQLEVQYYLCPDCADRRTIWTTTSGIVSAVAFGGIFAGLSLEMWTMMAPMIGTFIVSFIAWMAFRSPPLRAVGHKQGTFTLRGASPHFLRAADRKQLPDSASGHRATSSA